MWFVLAGTALIIVITGGIYSRRRAIAAIRDLGGSEIVARRVGLLMRWFLFGYPALFIVFVLFSLVLGRDSVTPPVSTWITWGLSIPFWVSMLVMLQALPFLLLIDLVNTSSRIFRKRELSRNARAYATLLPLLVFLIYTPVRILVEKENLEVRSYSIGTDNGNETFRIAFVGDLQQD